MLPLFRAVLKFCSTNRLFISDFYHSLNSKVNLSKLEFLVSLRIKRTKKSIASQNIKLSLWLARKNLSLLDEEKLAELVRNYPHFI